MEVLFIDQNHGYDYEIDDHELGVKIYNNNKNEKKYFSFSNCEYYKGCAGNLEIVFQLSFTSTHFFYVLKKGDELFGVRQKIRDKTNIFDQRIQIYDKSLKINKTGIASISLYVLKGKKRVFGKRINGILSRKQQNEWIKIKLPIEEKKILGSIKLKNRAFFITYYPNKEAISLSKVFVEEIDSRIKNVVLRNRSNVEIYFRNKRYNFDFRKKEGERGTRVFGNKKGIPNSVILTIKINKRKYYLYSYRGMNYVTSVAKKAYGINTKLKLTIFNNDIIIFGKYNNSYKKITGECDYIYIKAADEPIGKFKRPFIKIWKSFVFAKVPLERFTNTEEIHRGMYMGNKYRKLFPFYMNNDLKEDFQVFGKKKVKHDIILFRANVGNGTSCTILPFAKEYSFVGTIKQRLAQKLESGKHGRQTNLYFEKFSSKADESAIKVFEEVQKQKTESDNYFILDKACDDFSRLKKQFGEKIVRKYSLKHYRLIYRADCFISSEFSNHVINDRIFINGLRAKITETPLIFLQHGIMFAKPIENPMAAGFRKKNVKINLKKIVISSELEANEFYKVGYEPDDLLLTGLATFDDPTVNKLTKYAYMPTYRFWEERLVYEGKLEETGYYSDIKNVIQAFESNGLLDKLLIVPHNKFAKYILDHFPNYKDNICTNPSRALTVAKIFITDYSSAIYDAINRGAYPIFWWKENSILIDNYQAEPSLNSDTAPGPMAYNETQLINLVRKAEKNNFKLENKYKNKYRKINNFSDNENTVRIVNYLKSAKII